MDDLCNCNKDNFVCKDLSEDMPTVFFLNKGGPYSLSGDRGWLNGLSGSLGGGGRRQGKARSDPMHHHQVSLEKRSQPAC